jgi:hypothetical protein
MRIDEKRWAEAAGKSKLELEELPMEGFRFLSHLLHAQYNLGLHALWRTSKR